MIKIKCPNCGRVLGDTEMDRIVCNANCRGCKQTVKIDLTVAKQADYLPKGGRWQQRNQ